MALEPCVLSLGSLNLDLEVRVERWPNRGETLAARDFVAAGGGKAANVAFFTRKLGLPSALLARMGDDVFGRMALEPLQQAGVELRYVRLAPGAASGVALIAVRPDGDKAILLAGNANDEWTTEDVTVAQAAVSEAAAGSVLVADLEVSPEVVRTIATACRKRGFRTLLDPSPARRMEPDLYALFDFILPNPSEAATLVGSPVRTKKDALRAAKALHDRGTINVFAKLPHGGCVLRSNSQTHLINAPKVKVVDKTGAGDAFAGAVAAAVLQGKAVEEAARLAVAAAAASVTRYGTQASYPDWTELQRFVASVTIATAPE